MDQFSQQINELSDNNRQKLLSYLVSKKKHRQKSIELERYLHLLNKCQAKTSNGRECSRRCLNVITNYCHCHIDNPEKYQNVKPKKHSIRQVTVDFDKINYDDYIKCRLIHVNGSYYLTDDYGILFDRKDYTIYGRVEGDKIYQF